MSDWWYIVVIVGLALVVILYLLYRSRRSDLRQDIAPTQRDFRNERETDRLAHMSEEDRAWETASLQRDRERREREDHPADADRSPRPPDQ